MKRRGLLLGWALAWGVMATARGEAPAATPGLAIHFLLHGSHDLPPLEHLIETELAPAGLNVLVLEVNGHFEYTSHPEAREEGVINREQVKSLVALCRKKGIRLIPMYNCVGHQSWKTNNVALLRAHPEFDETPWAKGDEPDFYCRSWCPLHPEVNGVVFDLIDELIDAFEADAVHVGLDEVFEIADAKCPRCQGKDPAELFAKAVNDLHGHIAGKRGKEVWMWGDRLLDGKETGYGKWEASTNGTAPAIDKIPTDIVICDWHYEPLEDYGGKPDRYRSVSIFLKKGFRVWTASWRNPVTAMALLEEGRTSPLPGWQGHMNTTWTGPSEFARAVARPDAKKGDSTLGAVETFRKTAEALKK